MRDTPCGFGITESLTQANKLGLSFSSFPKQIVSYTPPLCRRGGWGVRLFFFIRVKNLDIPSNKIVEIKVKNTYCEQFCNSQKIK